MDLWSKFAFFFFFSIFGHFLRTLSIIKSKKNHFPVRLRLNPARTLTEVHFGSLLTLKIDTWTITPAVARKNVKKVDFWVFDPF